jgi:hypothetical protein
MSGTREESSTKASVRPPEGPSTAPHTTAIRDYSKQNLFRKSGGVKDTSCVTSLVHWCHTCTAHANCMGVMNRSSPRRLHYQFSATAECKQTAKRELSGSREARQMTLGIFTRWCISLNGVDWHRIVHVRMLHCNVSNAAADASSGLFLALQIALTCTLCTVTEALQRCALAMRVLLQPFCGRETNIKSVVALHGNNCLAGPLE